jgi:RNA polymerase sigma-32 factor
MASPVNKFLSADEALSAYAVRIARYEMLSAEQERELAVAARAGDASASERLVTSHLRYVLKIAFGYRGYGLPMADLVSEGNLGLMRAVEGFDPDRGFRLSTFALWWIRAMIGEYVLKNWSLVKIGTTADQKKIFFNLSKVKRKLGIESIWLSDADSRRLSKAMGVSEREVREMDVRMTQVASLNAPTRMDDAEGEEFQDLLPSPERNAEAILVEQDEFDQRHALIGEALAALKPRELKVFRERRLSDTPRTLEELGEEFGVSRERVRQIEVAAFSKVQRHVMHAAVAAGIVSHAPRPYA